MNSERPDRAADAGVRREAYVLGTDEAELARLGLQHRLWSGAAHAAWERAGLRPGMSVLDAGCGPGFAAFDMAQIVGAEEGRVVGVDESPVYVAHLNAQAGPRGLPHLHAVVGDVGDLPGPTGLQEASFDVAYARWVLCFVPDPAAVLRGVGRLLKPGGRLVVQDYFNYESMTTAPRSASFTKAVRATGEAWRRRGGNPDVVGRLPEMLAAEGFRMEHLDVNQRLARPGTPMWHWPQSFWRNFLPVLVQMGLLTEQDRVEWERDWAELSRTPTAFVVLPPVFDVVAVRV
jgi:ubiquinone/menaquinone biosynthesis C-methylase UbiE